MQWIRALIVTGCATMLGAGAAVAQTKQPAQSPVVSQLERCRQIADTAQRLACYDAASKALVDATSSGQVSVVDRGQVQRARRSLFGFSMPKLPFLSGGGDDIDRLDSTIKAVSVGKTNHRIQIVLVDGAVWEITEPPITFSDPVPGQKITILRGALGNYFLRVNGQVGVRGRRIG